METLILARMKTVAQALKLRRNQENQSIVVPPMEEINPLFLDSVAVEELSKRELHVLQQNVDHEMQKEWNEFKDARNSVQISHKKDADIEFWKEKFTVFRHVYHVFCQVRGVPASNGDLEEEFAVGKHAVPPQSEAMLGETLSNLVICKSAIVTQQLFDGAIARKEKGSPM